MPVILTPPPSLVEIEGSGELVYAPDGLSGRRKARVKTTELNSALAFLLGAINLTTSTEIVYTPQPWPGIPGLLVDSIRTSPWGKSSNSSWSSAVIPHAFTKLEIEYKTLQFQKLTDDKEKPQNEDYLMQEVNYSCDTVIIPVKVTDTNNSAQTSTREVKHYIRLPRIEYVVTIPKVKYPRFSIIAELNGKVNSKAVFGGAPETVLFDGPKLNNTISSLNDPAWKFQMSFIYNPKGWNKTLHPETLNWVNASALDGGTRKPYETADLTRLWTRDKT